MNVPLKEKFKNIDILFENHSLFFTELEDNTPTLKKYGVMSLKGNSKEKEEITQKIHKLIKKNDDIISKTKELKEYNEQLKAKTQEFIKKAEIICELKSDYIQVKILYVNGEETVIYKFKENEYMSPLISYLDNNLGQKMLGM